MVHTKLIEKYFSEEYHIIKSVVLFTLAQTNFGLLVKVFRHYIFSSLGTPDNHSWNSGVLRNPV